MKHFKNFLSLSNILIIVFAVIAAVVLYFVGICLTQDAHLQDYCVSLSASCLAIIPTIVIVNYISDSRWGKARSISEAELEVLIDMHLKNIVMIWGYMIGAGEEDQLTANLLPQRRKQYFQVIKNKLTENAPADCGQGLDRQYWWVLTDNMKGLEGQFMDFMSVHAANITAPLQTKLLALKSSLERLNSSLKLGNSALAGDWNAWEERFASKEYAISNYEKIKENASLSLYDYLKSLESFSKMQ